MTLRIHFASACPDAALFRLLAGRLAALGPRPPGHRAPRIRAPSTPNPDTDNLNPRRGKAPNANPCPLKITR